MENPTDAEISAPGAQRSLGEVVTAAGSEPPGGAGFDAAWREELALRLQAYRARRKKAAPNLAQSAFSFEAEARPEPHLAAAVEVAEIAEAPAAREDEEFSFTLAIGRNAEPREDSRLVIDVSAPAAAEPSQAFAPASEQSHEKSEFPVASVEERRIAGLVDAGCLLFAYGGFLTLFGSLGGQFTFSKLSAAVCAATFVFVYLQYFALFTVFGGTTPGMMLRGLQVMSFTSETPSPRQMLLRSLGYMISAGTFFMGFLWALWDEDGLTWHDRLSKTYLSPAPRFADIEAKHAAHTR